MENDVNNDNDGSHLSKKQPTGDYEVGYCRPPRAGQWPRGQSGNPRGRRKRTNKRHQDIVRILREEMIAQVSAIEGGSEVMIDMLRFLAKQLVADLVKGNPAQRLRLFKELLSLGVLQPGAEDHELDGNAVNRMVEQLAKESGLIIDENGQYVDPSAR
jgi:hypothetical protein